MCKDRAAWRHQRQAVHTNAPINVDILLQQAPSFGLQRLLELGERRTLVLPRARPHAVDGPEKIHRCRARLRQSGADRLELRRDFLGRTLLQVLDPKGNAARSRHTNGRRATHHHGADRFRHLLVRATLDVLFHQREFALVEQPDTVRVDFNSSDNGFHDSLNS